jgi:hypothetical protein
MESVVGALKDFGCKPGAMGRQWLANCPVCRTLHPSLLVSEGRYDLAILHCYQGCSAEQVVKALGLSMSVIRREDNDWWSRRAALCIPRTYLNVPRELIFGLEKFSPLQQVDQECLELTLLHARKVINMLIESDFLGERLSDIAKEIGFSTTVTVEPERKHSCCIPGYTWVMT